MCYCGYCSECHDNPYRTMKRNQLSQGSGVWVCLICGARGDGNISECPLKHLHPPTKAERK